VKSGTIKAAFLVPANLLALATASLASVFTGDPIPALVALGVEGLYLGALSSIPGFRRANQARARADEEAQGQRAELDALVAELAPSQQDHYRSLVALREKILANYRRLPGGGIVAASSASRLDSLLTSFLRLLSTLNQYRTYLNHADRTQVEVELASLEQELAAEPEGRLREVKAKRVDILRRRQQRFAQANESREVVSHQLAGIEDMLRLTHEQSIAIRDPELVNRQLDVLSAEVEATDETVRELERFMEFTDEVRSPVSHAARGSER